MTTVPNKMKSAEKIKERSGIISRLRERNHHIISTNHVLNMCFLNIKTNFILLPIIVKKIVNHVRQVVECSVNPFDYKHLKPGKLINFRDTEAHNVTVICLQIDIQSGP